MGVWGALVCWCPYGIYSLEGERGRLLLEISQHFVRKYNTPVYVGSSLLVYFWY